MAWGCTVIATRPAPIDSQDQGALIRSIHEERRLGGPRSVLPVWARLVEIHTGVEFRQSQAYYWEMSWDKDNQRNVMEISMWIGTPKDKACWAYFYLPTGREPQYLEIEALCKAFWPRSPELKNKDWVVARYCLDWTLGEEHS